MEVLDICVGILFCRTNNDEELTDRVSGKFGKCNIHGKHEVWEYVHRSHPFYLQGVFHSCKPSDMLANLQGQLPTCVELKGLGQEVDLCLFEF
jgi:predicted nucleic acid-binding Zn finger protein